MVFTDDVTKWVLMAHTYSEFFLCVYTAQISFNLLNTVKIFFLLRLCAGVKRSNKDLLLWTIYFYKEKHK